MGINVLRPLVGWDYAAGGRGLFFLDLGLHQRSPPQTGPSPQQGSTALQSKQLSPELGGEDWMGVSVLTTPVPCMKEQEAVMHEVGR